MYDIKSYRIPNKIVMKKFIIGNDTLKISLHAPDGVEGYYRGTRFDWAGVFESIVYKECNYAEEWFENYSPLMHDAVCGPAEEFGPIGLEGTAAGDPFLKIGVGILERMDNEPYDRFKLHKILEPGIWKTVQDENSLTFIHELSSGTGFGYDYMKRITVTGENSFRISHRLANTGSKELKGDVYNHNFFTLGLLESGPTRLMDFPFKPEGDWRADYSEVGFKDNGIRFTRRLEKGESVFTSNLHESGKGMNGSPNAFELMETKTGRGVKMTCPVQMTRMVFWSNHMIACLEPYIDFSILPGETFEFDIDYSLL